MPSELLPTSGAEVSSNEDDERLSALAQTCEPGTPVFVLIDPLVGEPLSVELDAEKAASLDALTRARSATWGRDIVPVELHSSIKLAPHFHPYLVALRGVDDPWLVDTFALAETERLASQAEGLAGEGRAVMRIGGWLHSSAHGEQIAKVLSEALRVRCETVVQARYQRLLDRRTLSWARRVAGEARVCALLGPIQRWVSLDATGSLTTLTRTSEAPSILRWSDKEWRTFMQGALVHQTVARYLGELALRGLPAPTVEREVLVRAHAALEQVAPIKKRWPNCFSEDHDDTAWAALVMLHGGIASSPMADKKIASNLADEPNATLHDMALSLSDALTSVLDAKEQKAST